jgi:hypothetical protein
MNPSARLRPLVRSETYRALLFLGLAVPIGVATLAIMVAG